MRSQFSSSLEQLIGYCRLAAVFTLPLACNPWGADIFELPKFLILITLAVLLVAFSLLHLAPAGPKLLPSDPALLWIVLGCSLTAVGATVLSVAPQDSLVGTFGRRQGLLTMLGYLVLMLSAALYLRSLDQVRQIIRLLVWTSMPLCLFGLLQLIGFNPFDWVTDNGLPLTATLGRSNFFGAYLVLVLPLTLVMLAGTGRRRWPLALLLVLQLAFLFLSRARSSWIGLGAVVVTWLFLRRIKPADPLPLPRFLLLLPVAATAWVLAGFLAEPLGLEPPAGFARISETILALGGSAAARLTIWQRSVDLILERPWLGYGFDTMEAVFSRSFPPELVYYQGRHVMVDRAHNLFLDVGMKSGLLGISTVAALLILVGRRIYRSLRTTDDPPQRLIQLGLAAALSGHLADLQFSFDQTANAAMFWLLLGVSVAVVRELPTAEPEQRGSRSSHLASGTLWLLLFTAIFSLWPLQALQADRLYAEAIRHERPLPDRIKDLERATQLHPRQTDYYLALAGMYGLEGNTAMAEQNLRTAWRMRPNDPWIMLMRGHLYAHRRNDSPAHLDKAEQAYRQVVELAPDISSFHTVLAVILARQRRPFAALDELKEALRLDETDPVAYEQLARLHELLGNRVQAREARRQAERWTRHEGHKPRPSYQPPLPPSAQGNFSRERNGGKFTGPPLEIESN